MHISSLSSIPLLATLLYIPLTTALLQHPKTASQFHVLQAKSPVFLAAFTSSSLESLQDFNAVFEEAATTQASENLGGSGEGLSRREVGFVMVDCDGEGIGEVCGELGISGLPALRLWRGKGEEGEGVGKWVRYRGVRSVRGITSFATRHSLGVLSELTPASVADFKTLDDRVIILYQSPESPPTLLSSFQDVASAHYGEYVFGYTTDVSIAKADGVEVPSAVVYKNSDGDHQALKGDFGASDLKALIKSADQDIVGVFSERDQDTYMVPNKLSVYIFVPSSDEQTCRSLRWALTPLAKKYQQYIKMGIADAVEYAPMAEGFGLKSDAFPALAVHAPRNDHVFLYAQGEAITAGSVEKMLLVILQGKAENGWVFSGGSEGHDEL